MIIPSGRRIPFHYTTAGVLACAITSAILLFSAVCKTAAEATFAEWSALERPTRETIPDDVPPAVHKLMVELLTGDAKLRAKAIIASKREGPCTSRVIPYLIENLGNGMTVSVGHIASDALVDLGAVAVEPLIEALRMEQYRSERALIVQLLHSIEDRRAIPSLIVALEDDNPVVRQYAAMAIAAMPDPRSYQPLIGRLQDANREVVHAAVLALGEIGDRRAVEPIITLLVESRKQGEDVLSVRQAAATALGRLGDRRAFDALLAAYKDQVYPSKEFSSRFLRENALEALGRIRDTRSFDVLRLALQNGDAYERIAAVWGLAGLGDARSIALLESLLSDQRQTDKWWKTGLIPRVRPTAARALISTDNDGAIDAVIAEYNATSPIEEDRQDSHYELHFRTAVVDGLAMSPNPRAYLAVIKILEGCDARMRFEATRVLASNTISLALSEMDVSGHPHRTLPALTDIRVLRALMKLVQSERPQTQASRITMKLFWDTQEYALVALRKSRNLDSMRFIEEFEKNAWDMPIPVRNKIERERVRY